MTIKKLHSMQTRSSTCHRLKKKKKFCDKTVVVICMWLTLICSMREVRLLTICINGWLVIAFLKNIKKCVTPLSNGDVRFKLPINQVEQGYLMMMNKI